MNEETIIADGSPAEETIDANKREFYVLANETGIQDVQISNDVPYALNVYLGIGQFIAGQLRNANTQQPPKLPEFLRDLANMVEVAQAEAANDPAPPDPEVA